MAGGIDWLRWHHGSTTDPKFALVAKRAGVRTGDVIAVWAHLLEAASQAEERGRFGAIDCEAIDLLFGFDDGGTAAILTAMDGRGLTADGWLVAWAKRQPKRERDDDSSTDRVRAHRQRQREMAGVTPGETPCNATERQETPRGEKRREEEEIPPSPPAGGEGSPAGFAAFWLAWPTSDRKQAKGKCLDAWKKAGAERHAAEVLAHVERLKSSEDWLRGYIPAPLVYLNQRRWDGAESAAPAAALGSFV